MNTTGCPSGKKGHISKEVAEGFAADVQQRNQGQVPQYAYACEECPNWHLSAIPPEAHAAARTRWPSALT